MKMNRNFLLMGCAAVLCVAGCATESDYVDSQDTSVAVKNSDRMSQSDWVIATQKFGDDLLNSPKFQEFLEAYKIDAEKAIQDRIKAGEKISTREKINAYKPLLMLSTIQNNTSEHIDTNLLTAKLREILFNSNKVRFTTYAAGQGQVIDAATAQARTLKSDPNVKRKAHSTQKGTVNAYDLSLGGVIIKQTATSGRKNEICYTFTLTLTDNETGEGVWTATKEIKRQHKQGGFGW